MYRFFIDFFIVCNAVAYLQLFIIITRVSKISPFFITKISKVHESKIILCFIKCDDIKGTSDLWLIYLNWKVFVLYLLIDGFFKIHIKTKYL